MGKDIAEVRDADGDGRRRERVGDRTAWWDRVGAHLLHVVSKGSELPCVSEKGVRCMVTDDHR